MNKKEQSFLAVYNICELKQNNLGWYVDCLTKLLDQDYTNYKILISGCKTTDVTKNTLVRHFGKNLLYNFIDDLYTVNVTFNKSIEVVVKELGNFDGYIYVDSGINARHHTNCFSEINKRSISDIYGMVAIQTDTDTGFDIGLGFDKGHYFMNNDYEIPVGKGINLHLQYFNDKLLRFYGRLIPDIFKAYCTESVFTFLNAALKLKWVIVKDMVLEHQKSVDGATVGFDHAGDKNTPWNNLFGGLDMRDIINDPYAKKIGMGYEECGKIMLHDPNAYDSNGYALYDELREYLKDKMFLKPEVIDYSKIKCNFIN